MEMGQEGNQFMERHLVTRIFTSNIGAQDGCRWRTQVPIQMVHSSLFFVGLPTGSTTSMLFLGKSYRVLKLSSKSKNLERKVGSPPKFLSYHLVDKYQWKKKLNHQKMRQKVSYVKSSIRQFSPPLKEKEKLRAVEEERLQEQRRREEAAAIESQEKLSKMTPKQKRLFELSLKINAGRQANRSMVAKEEKGELGGKGQTPASRKRKPQNDQEKEELEAEKARAMLGVTAETAQAYQKKIDQKVKGQAAFGWDIFNQDSLLKVIDTHVTLFIPLISVARRTRSA